MMALVCAAGGVAAWIVATVVGPRLFHTHLLEAGLGGHDAATHHAEEAYSSASAYALLAAFMAAALTSLAASLWLARRLSRSLGALTGAATAVGSGTFGVAVEGVSLGPEFEQLVASFNSMAARLQQSEALRERLLADLAHELRTPVANLEATLEAISDGMIGLDEATIARLRDQGRRLTRLAEDLASVTRAQAGELSLERVPVPPRILIERAIEAGFARSRDKGVSLTSAVAAGVPEVRVDPERMAQVLDNLIANALVHCDRGGTVTVGATVAATGVVLTVADDGAGIAPEHVPHIFERFYRADDARDRDSGGSGVGLAICKAIVEAHGGAITATSDGPGRGAVFTVTLPPASETS